MSSIVDIINHYQTSINKSLNDTARIVHCIGKLYKLPISVRHLQDTGIGRTVNSLRKYDGEVGIAAKALVTKWKAMVAAEESDDNTANAATHGEGADSEGRQNDERQQRSDMSDQEEDGHNRSLADDDDEDDDEDDDDEDDDDDGDGGGGGGGSNNEDRVSHADQDVSYGEPHLRMDEGFSGEVEANNSNSDEEASDGQVTQPEVHYVMHHRVVEPEHPISSEDRATSSQWNDHHHSSKRHSHGSAGYHQHHTSTSKTSSSSSSVPKHKNDDRSDKRKNEVAQHRESSNGGETKSHKSSSSTRTDHQESSKKSSSHGDGERHKNRSSSKHHSGSNTNDCGAGSSSNNSSSHSRKDSSHKKDRHRSKEKRSGSSKRHATEETDADRDTASSSKRSRKEHRTDHGSGMEDSTMQVTSASPRSASTSSSHSKKDKSKGHSSSSSSSSKRRGDHEKSESLRERSDESKSKSRRKDKSRSSPALNQEHHNDDSVGEDGNEGLDCSGGASFADALAMIGMPSGSKKKPSGSNKEKVKVTVMKSSSSSTSSSQRDSEAPYSRIKQEQPRASSSTSSTSGGRNGGIPTASELLSQNVKLEPLPEASEIVESLPMISPHYRPMPLNQTVMECVFMGGQSGRGKGRPLTEEEALGQSMQSKNIRTKVYSGMKTNAKGVIPTLYELCIRLLQDHIDEIGATGGIPFYILKPVLERANPNQLLHLEHFNPHFVEDSDVLWEQHCKRTFRSKQRNEEELETWREMFLRCSEERDAKLRSLTQNIKLSQEQAAAPIRKTQLAYVDSAVKPPRNVISKQVKYGTARAPVVSPAARVAALKAGNVAQVGDARLRVAAGVRDNAQAQVFQPTKPRKAPMMAKVLSSMKGFKTSFRR
uniref:TFIIS N-terminal domain-containing protein n=1 Tax=Anopheles minimus TaxID=112268 RepID=A0A182W345_9DIPT